MLSAAAAGGPRPAADERPRVVAAMPRWLPAEPLVAVLDAHCSARSLRALVRASGVDRRTFERLRHRRRVRSDCADRIAVALGRHPSEIWPDWFAGGAA